MRRAAAVALALAAALPGCGGSDAERAVVLLSVDTLPADRVGAWGCPEARTPAMDRLARRGLQVIDAVAPAPLTLPSHATMLTGLEPAAHGLRDNGLSALGAGVATVAELLDERVRRAGFVGAFPLHGRWGLGRGFELWDDEGLDAPVRLSAPERRAEEVLGRAAGWLLGTRGTRFAFVHVFDPHHPWEAPAPWPRALRAGGGERWTARYDAEVAATDREIARFLRALAAGGCEVTVLLTADHGEALGAHGEATHGLTVYDAVLRVPLALAGPGIPARLELRARGTVDVAPTLLDLLGADDRAGAQWPGSSLEGPAAGDAHRVESLHPKLYRGWAPLFGVRTGRWKYVEAPRPELYDLARDPGELEDVIAEHPDVAERLRASIADVVESARRIEPDALSDDAREKLEALGYLATAGPDAFAGLDDPKDRVPAAGEFFFGHKAFLKGDLDEARRRLERSAALDPSEKQTHAYLAGTYLALGRFDEAVAAGERALATPPALNEAPIRATIGEALLRAGRPAEAVPWLERAAADSPRDARLGRLLREARGD